METPLLKMLADIGTLGIVAALAIWQVQYLTKKLITVIENNTKALTEMYTIIHTKCNREPL